MLCQFSPVLLCSSTGIRQSIFLTSASACQNTLVEPRNYCISPGFDGETDVWLLPFESIKIGGVIRGFKKCRLLLSNGVSFGTELYGIVSFTCYVVSMSTISDRSLPTAILRINLVGRRESCKRIYFNNGRRFVCVSTTLYNREITCSGP